MKLWKIKPNKQISNSNTIEGMKKDIKQILEMYPVDQTIDPTQMFSQMPDS